MTAQIVHRIVKFAVLLYFARNVQLTTTLVSFHLCKINVYYHVLQRTMHKL